MNVKLCRACGERKPVSEFYDHRSTRDGKNSSCKDCCTYRARQLRHSRAKQRVVNQPPSCKTVYEAIVLVGHDEHWEGTPDETGCEFAPGTREKIERMAARVEQGIDPFCDLDATDCTGLTGVKLGGGAPPLAPYVPRVWRIEESFEGHKVKDSDDL